MVFTRLVSRAAAAGIFGALACTVGRLAGAATAEPQPQPAITAIAATLDRYRIVAIPAAHGDRELDDFIFALLSDRAVQAKVDDLIVECGNSLYQDRLDEYVAGGDVSLLEVRQVWRNTTQEMCGLSGFYERLFPFVRELNRTLPSRQKLRVLAADPPIDWDLVKTRAEVSRFSGRDEHIASVVAREVLDKGHRALMLFGAFHLFHHPADDPIPWSSAVGLYERRYPGVTFVVANGRALGGRDSELEAATAGWPLPSLVEIGGTRLADLPRDLFFPPLPGERVAGDSRRVGAIVDGLLFLEPREGPAVERIAEPVADAAYAAELKRRGDLRGLGPGSIGPADAAARRAQPPAPAAPAGRSIAAADLKRLTGFYESQFGTAPLLQIELVGDRLIARLPPPDGRALIPLSETRFQPEGMPADFFLDFELADGQVKRVTFETGPDRPPVIFTPCQAAC